jgi:hypothetical protein
VEGSVCKKRGPRERCERGGQEDDGHCEVKARGEALFDAHMAVAGGIMGMAPRIPYEGDDEMGRGRQWRVRTVSQWLE